MPGAFSAAKAYTIGAICEGILHAAYTAIFGLVIFLLLRTHSWSAVNKTLICSTVLIYLLSTAHLALTCFQALQTHRDTEGILTDPSAPRNYVQYIIEGITYICADSVIIWRTWIIWGRRWWAFAVPGLLVCGTIGMFSSPLLPSGIGYVWQMSIATNVLILHDEAMVRWGILFSAFTLGTNVVVMLLIALRAWVHHKEVHETLSDSGSTTIRLLILITESGLWYCLVWVVYVAVRVGTSSNGEYIVQSMLAQLTGIYPSCVVVFVYLRYSRRPMEQLSTSSRLPDFRRLTGMTAGGSYRNVTVLGSAVASFLADGDDDPEKPRRQDNA
ncbi:hypothetical protein PUNSTDRAFT_145610 [Punctularia strigosozonata HHB-11173 SS5]|uniref:uncharacterized protein n=1 Tax=Punctularia strigosozonata (strain HHB-11173) TaxID=741275 RepID=UPI0004418378|nr:uncharacterized protein PUNSTDRAFT_145610 [Punctularia strigosozonata HHB-11173 SS5]EIN05638.1 hypothetical protein PUNSTDRAFT_145610 [Punctularia strigosozonata HHB-11173 SS5]